VRSLVVLGFVAVVAAVSLALGFAAVGFGAAVSAAVLWSKWLDENPKRLEPIHARILVCMPTHRSAEPDPVGPSDTTRKWPPVVEG
jgi:hypothetical protein